MPEIKTPGVKAVVWTLVALLAASVATLLLLRAYRWGPGSTHVDGAVLRNDPDTRKQLPIPGVIITLSDGVTTIETKSDAAGYFHLVFQKRLLQGQKLHLGLRHPEYRPLDLTLVTMRRRVDKLYVESLTPNVSSAEEAAGHQMATVSNIRIRYSRYSQTEINIGSVVRTFQAVNKGGLPCKDQQPCSPDGDWKAAIGSVQLDAGTDNVFRSVRASCIAGPCPFTRIDSSGFAKGGRNIRVTALDWSDTATFLLEAEVFHTTMDSKVRESYPVVFGRALNFTVPPTQEGVSLEAEIDKTPMVFPLGPDLYLSWATCSARIDADNEQTTVYRCELKPGYRF